MLSSSRLLHLVRGDESALFTTGLLLCRVGASLILDSSCGRDVAQKFEQLLLPLTASLGDNLAKACSPWSAESKVCPTHAFHPTCPFRSLGTTLAPLIFFEGNPLSTFRRDSWLTQAPLGSAQMACRLARLNKMAPTGDESASRVKPDDAETRPVNTRSAAATHGGRGRDGTKSMLNPESEIWVPKTDLAASQSVGSRRTLIFSLRGAALTREPKNQVDFPEAGFFQFQEQVNGINGQYEMGNDNYETGSTSTAHDAANGMLTPRGSEAKADLSRVSVKPRSHTIATAGSGPPGFFEQMTFNLLNETLRGSNGRQAGTS